MWPGNVGLRFLPPMIVLGGSCLIFGLCLCVMSAAQSYAAVLVTRVLIGASQAFIQGLGLYVTLWYKRDEVATRGGMIDTRIKLWRSMLTLFQLSIILLRQSQELSVV